MFPFQSTSKFLTLFLIILISTTLGACGRQAGNTAARVVTLTSPAIPTAGAPQSAPSGVESPLVRLPTAVLALPTVDPSAPLWVTNPSDDTLLRIDPQMNTINQTVKMQGAPETVVWDAEWVWVLDRANDRLYRLDAENPRDFVTVDLPEGSVETLSIGSNAVWVGMVGGIDLDAQIPAEQEDGEGVELLPPGWVAKIDPKTAEVIDRLDVQPVIHLSALGSTLWVLSRTEIDTPVQVLDLSSRQGMAVPVHNAPEWIAAETMAISPDGLWLFSSAHGRIFHADLGGQVHSSVKLDVRKPTGYADLLVTPDALWAATPWGEVMKIDLQTNHVLGQVDLGAPLSGLLQGGGDVWALSQQTGVLYRLDPSGSGIKAQIATGSPLQPTVIPSPTPRVVIWQPCEDAAPSRLKVGDIAYVTKDPPVPNRVRQEPNLTSEILGLVNPGASVKITGGPTCAEGWVWWQVENADFSGWTSEGDKETYWLVPLIP